LILRILRGAWIKPLSDPQKQTKRNDLSPRSMYHQGFNRRPTISHH